MKIALFTDGISPYVIGGMQKHSFNLAKYFARNKIYVDLYHTNQSTYDISALDFFTKDEKQYIRSFVLEFPSLGSLPGHYIRESFEYSSRIFSLFSKNAGVDFIYAKGFTAWKLLDEKRKGYPCAPIGVNFHGFEMFQKAASFRSALEQVLLLRKPVMFNIENADLVFSYGGKITDLILGLGIQREKIIESPAGIEKDWIVSGIHPSKGVRKFIFVGRFERRKGIEELSNVLQNLVFRNNFEFSFVGDIPEKKRIISSSIRYLGKIRDPEVMKKVLGNSDILVCPSHSEGMPNVILEAMANGLAVLASDVGAVNKLVSVKNGWLIEAGNKKELKNALADAINQPQAIIDQFKKNSIAKVQFFLWDNIILQLLADIQSKTKIISNN
jgi:glycosyltransferase involved in cell wall biosynthesis